MFRNKRSEMAPFRWPKVEHDIVLCREVVASRPSRPEEWEAIASTLSVLFSKEDSQVQLKGRGCREHTELLIKKFKSEQTKALKRSGCEEDYTELTQLLEDITLYEMNRSEEIETQKLKKKGEAESDKQKGISMREAAMKTHTKRGKEDSSGGSSDEGQGSENKSSCSKKKKPRRASKVQMLDYLSTKHADNLKLKEKQLELEEKRLKIEEKKIALDEQKWMYMASAIAQSGYKNSL